MTRAGEELGRNSVTDAVSDYRSALQLEPANPEAMEGLGGALLKAQQGGQAEEVFSRAVRQDPARAGAWRGLLAAFYQQDKIDDILKTARDLPPAVKETLSRDPEYLRIAASALSKAGREKEAQNVLAQALDLASSGSREMTAATELQYAALLFDAGRFSASARLYRQVLTQDHGNVEAWQGLVRVEHQEGADAEALRSLEEMPEEVSHAAFRDAGFLGTVAAVDQSQHQLDKAQAVLEEAIELDRGAGVSSLPLETQLAEIDLELGDAAGAYAIYREQVEDDSRRSDSWKGLVNVLHRAGRDAEAVACMGKIPAAARQQLNQDPAYMTLAGSVYASVGQLDRASTFLRAAAERYAAQQADLPADLVLQIGWVALRQRDDRTLSSTVTQLGGRKDLTVDQQRQLALIWASWTVERADQAVADGQNGRAIEILSVASRAFRGNAEVEGNLAGALLQAGAAKQAEEIYLAIDLRTGSAEDFRGAVSAALAAHDNKQAELWLDTGLARYRNDAGLLRLGAQMERSRGDFRRAKAYYEAALNAMEDPAGPGSTGEWNVSGKSIGSPTGRAESSQQELLDLLAPQGASQQPAQKGAFREQKEDWDVSDLPGFATASDLATATPSSGRGALPAGDSLESSSLGSSSFLSRPADAFPLRQGSSRRTEISRDGEDDTGGMLPKKKQQTAVSASAWAEGAPRESNAAEGRSSDIATGDISTGDISASRQYAVAESPLKYSSSVLSHGQAHERARDRVSTEKTASDVPAVLDPADSEDIKGASAGYSRSPTPGPLGSSMPGPIQGRTQGPMQVNDDIEQSHRDRIGVEPEQSHAAPRPRQSRLLESSLDLPRPSAGDESAANLIPGGPVSSSGTAVVAAASRSNGSGSDQPAASPRTAVEDQLAGITAEYSPWAGGSAEVSYRSGQAGLDRLAIFAAPVESSIIAGSLRATIITTPVLLDSGAADGTGSIRLGTAPLASASAQQPAYGAGAEMQLRSQGFAASLGYTPYGFPVSNFTAGFYLHPQGAPFTVSLSRESVTDTQLSYAGVRDPGTGTPGNVWGGVMSSGGELEIADGTAQSGWYVQGGGQRLTGVHVESNARVDGDGGAYWQVYRNPDNGELTVGMNFFAMHYAHNLRYLTYGQGGYFSPAIYMLAGVPLSFTGHSGANFHYRIQGSLGVQAFAEDSALYFPLDSAIEAANGNPVYAARTSVGGNYSLDGEGAYAIGGHWFVGGRVALNNSRDYDSSNVGFFLRYVFHEEHPSETGSPTGLFSSRGFRPLTVP